MENEILASMSSKTTSRNNILVTVAMATREMALVPPVFNREIKNFAQISTIVRTIILRQHFGFLLVQQKIMKITNFHIFSQNSLLCRGK